MLPSDPYRRESCGHRIANRAGCHPTSPIFRVGVGPTMRSILTINGGSSSVRFAQFSLAPDSAAGLERTLDGKIERVQDTDAALRTLRDKLAGRFAGERGDAIGHRLVHGLNHRQPVRITSALLDV